jgi:hypothetical protein
VVYRSSNGGWFFIDQSSLIILTLHLIYSLTTFFLTGRGIAAWLLPRICIILDISFAAGITFLTEGPTSPSWLFFVFAIIVVDSRELSLDRHRYYLQCAGIFRAAGSAYPRTQERVHYGVTATALGKYTVSTLGKGR